MTTCEHRRSARVPGWVGWLGLVAYVFTFDAHPHTETLSHSFAPCGRRGRGLALLLWTYVTLHLTRTLPERYDPLRQLPTIHRKEV